MGTHSITREELYALVWTDPMTVVAARFGISDVSLAGVCLNHKIPVPPRGYWAKLRSRTAKTPRRKRLPPLTPGVSAEVQLRARERRSYAKRLGEEALAEGEAARLAAVAYTEAVRVFPRTESGPLHPLVAEAKAALKVDGDPPTMVCSGRGLIEMDISANLVDRALLLADAFLTALEKQGHRVEADAEGVGLIVREEVFRLRVYETRTPVLLLPADTKLKAERDEAARRDPWNFPRSWSYRRDDGRTHYDQWAKHPAGRLAFTLRRGRRGWWESIGAWHDWSKKKAEDYLGQALVEIEAAGAAFGAQSRLRDEERKREEREAEARRRKARLRTLLIERARDYDRLRQLTGLLGHVDAFERGVSGDAVDVIVRELRAMITEAESGLGREALGAEFAEWLKPGN